MNILETLMGEAGIAKQLANQFGVDPDQAASALGALVPALAGGMKEKLESGAGGGLLEMLTGGALNQFADNPAALSSPAAMQQGQSLLNSIFGGGNLGGIVSMVAEKAGIGEGVIEKMLPVVTAVLGGMLAKNVGNDPAELTNMLGTLAAGGEGGLLGAVKGLAAKIFG
jgi:hypothetical protein